MTITYFFLSYIYDFSETVHVYKSYKLLFASTSLLILDFITYHSHSLLNLKLTKREQQTNE